MINNTFERISNFLQERSERREKGNTVQRRFGDITGDMTQR